MALRITGSVIGEPITSSSSSATGMWLSQEVAALQQDGIWQIAPGFTLTSSAATVNEGASITITLTTTGIPNGAAVPYVISGANIFANDSANGVITGNFVIQNNSNTISFAANADLLTEGSEAFTITAGGASTSVTINDTSLTPDPSDAQFPYTTLALHGNGTNNSQNNTFLDSSTNTLAITRNGNPSQGTFSPYGGNWSNYFDGSDYLTVPASSAFAPGTGDFTVEGWINANNLMPSYGMIFGQTFSGSNYFTIFAANGTIAYINNNGSWFSGTSWTVGTWNHFAVVRNSGSTKVYLNGVGGTAAADTFNFTNITDLPTIGRYTHTASNFFEGYISNLRYVKGTAVYTSNFTPSTTPLTAITNTSLLTCQDNRLIDDSPNNFTITKNGDVSVQRFSPFSPVITTPTSYSGYFDGNGDFITAPSTGFSTTGDLTLECWAYVNSASAYGGLGGMRNSEGAAGLSINILNTGYLEWAINTNYAGTLCPLNQWFHVALVRSGSSANNCSCYLNGTRVGQFSSTTEANATDVFIIGRYYANGANQYFLNGYVSNMRYVKGTALYSGTTYTVPTTPLTAITNTSLLTCQSPTFIDNSINNLTISTAGNSQPTTVNPFGFTNTSSEYSTTTFGGSGYFDGTGDYLVTPASSALALATNAADFTIECWLYNNGGAGSQYGRGICVYYPSGGYGSNRLMFRLVAGQNRINVYLLANSGAEFGSSGTDGTATVTLNAWTHVALVRNAGVFYVYVNGVLDITVNSSSAASSIPFTTFNTIEVGRTQDGSVPDWNGYISNYRFVKGTAVYKANFAPPVAPVTAVANTQLLCNFTNAGIIDNAMMNNLETIADAKISTTQSKYGGSSMSFDGNGDYLDSPSILSAQFGTGDFTIEGWLYINSLAAAQVLFEFRAVNGASYGQIYITTSGVLRFYLPTDIGTSNTLSAGAWTHFAITRASGTLRMFIGGVQGYSNSHTSAMDATRLRIGADVSGGNGYNGYIDDLRITKGFARYTANFTPPTEFANK
jgi:hypothetical protein